MKNTIATCLVLALSSLPAAAEGFSWTGTYEGHFVCDHVNGGAAGGFSRSFLANIRHTGTSLDVETFAVISPETKGKPSLYRGKVQEIAGGKVMAGYLEACKGRFDYKELVRIFPATSAGQSFSFAADTIFTTEALPGAEGRLVVESCKWALKRVSAEVPEFEACPE
ncbi:hypothetical protein [Anderseniella sp. Alg231-50]|uniref:hypothetical protein n=1 Tax=Anderseniella sp. Alg231-50 TaxID=1922226 RepID=UPI000D55D1AB